MLLKLCRKKTNSCIESHTKLWESLALGTDWEPRKAYD